MRLGQCPSIWTFFFEGIPKEKYMIKNNFIFQIDFIRPNGPMVTFVFKLTTSDLLVQWSPCSPCTQVNFISF